MPFLRRHGPDLFTEVRAAYVDTLSRVLSSHFRAYLAALDAAKVRPRAASRPAHEPDVDVPWVAHNIESPVSAHAQRI